jgi:hypothetical protein
LCGAVVEQWCVHSVAYHWPSGTFFVADRGNNRTQQISAMGDFLSQWTCMRGVIQPWAVRFATAALAVVAGGTGQSISILDASGVGPSGAGPCRVLDTMPVNAAQCNLPHLIDVDELNSDLYVACVGLPASTVLRYRFV